MKFQKHLRVLEKAGVVRRARVGREAGLPSTRGRLKQSPPYLTHISEQWDEALLSLKAFVES